MFGRIVLFFALSVQACIALAAEDPVMKNWQKHLANQEAYHMNTQRSAAETRASISMTPEKKANVKQLVERSTHLQDGSKVKIGSSVTRPVNTAKVAEALAERFKNAGKYAKNLGKASLPSFVGTAAFHGLMNGVDYVLDPKNNTIVKKPDPSDPDPKTQQCTSANDNCSWSSNVFADSNWPHIGSYASADAVANAIFRDRFPDLVHIGLKSRDGCYFINSSDWLSVVSCPQRKDNPYYTQGTEPPTNQPVPATDAEIVAALKKALESNNPALASAIAEAMKSAYTQDNSEGQPKTTNPLIAEIGDDMQSAVDSAFDNPQPNPKNPERPSGYYKVTDGEKTIEGYVRPSDTSAGTTTDSTGSSVTDPSTGVTTTTGSSSSSTSWPPFCDYAAIVCEWIGWTKEDPEADEDLEQPQAPRDQGIFDKEFDFKFEFGGSCPPDYVFTWKTKPFDGQHTFDLSWLCKIFTFLGYPLVFLSHCMGFWIFYEAAIRKEFKF